MSLNLGSVNDASSNQQSEFQQLLSQPSHYSRCNNDINTTTSSLVASSSSYNITNNLFGCTATKIPPSQQLLRQQHLQTIATPGYHINNSSNCVGFWAYPVGRLFSLDKHEQKIVKSPSQKSKLVTITISFVITINDFAIEKNYEQIWTGKHFYNNKILNFVEFFDFCPCFVCKIGIKKPILLFSGNDGLD